MIFYEHWGFTTNAGFFIQPLCGNAGNICCRKTEFLGNFGPEFCNLVEYLLLEYYFQNSCVVKIPYFCRKTEFWTKFWEFWPKIGLSFEILRVFLQMSFHENVEKKSLQYAPPGSVCQTSRLIWLKLERAHVKSF